MTQPINIKVERNVIPINIGGVQLEFDSTDENIGRFIEMSENKDAFLAQLTGDLAEEADAVSARLNDKVTGADYKRYFEIEKVGLQRIYDLMFGEGTFDRLYAKWPDVSQLLAIFNQISTPLGQALAEKIAKRRAAELRENKVTAAQVVAMKQNKRRQNRRRK